MILAFIIISTAGVVFLIVYRQVSEKRKYQDIVYLKNLQLIIEFIDFTQTLNDYVTWVQRDQIKSRYSEVGRYFKNKSNVYKKEENVKKFNDLYQDFDNYIITYNKNYVLSQKEKLTLYFYNIEGKKLDNQQRTALITEEYSNLIIAGSGSVKTLTILGKVKYLIEQKSVKPEIIIRTLHFMLVINPKAT